MDLGTLVSSKGRLPCGLDDVFGNKRLLRVRKRFLDRTTIMKTA